MYLPYSQRYAAGYVACHLPEFIEYFDGHYVQLPLEKGDAVFFNPALFHGAGTNRSSEVRRMANLLQISSAFGRAMETVDRIAMTRRCSRVRAADGVRSPRTAPAQCRRGVRRGVRLPDQPRS